VRTVHGRTYRRDALGVIAPVAKGTNEDDQSWGVGVDTPGSSSSRRLDETCVNGRNERSKR
jgi:hypothetical protein